VGWGDQLGGTVGELELETRGESFCWLVLAVKIHGIDLVAKRVTLGILLQRLLARVTTLMQRERQKTNVKGKK
jgi:hypothetical protein